MRERVVASLTTLPQRFASLEPTLISLATQTRPLAAIHLHLPHRDRHGRKRRQEQPDLYDPALLTKWKRLFPQLVVHHHRKVADCGPLMKLLPTLACELDPKTYILTVDDDRIYDSCLVAVLLDHSRTLLRSADEEGCPPFAVGLSGWAFGSSGFLLGWSTMFVADVDRPQQVSSLRGTDGILYRRNCFPADVDEAHRLLLRPQTQRPREAFFVDDVCISGCLGLRGCRLFVVPAEGCLQRHRDNAAAVASGVALSSDKFRCFKRFSAMVGHFRSLDTRLFRESCSPSARGVSPRPVGAVLVSAILILLAAATVLFSRLFRRRTAGPVRDAFMTEGKRIPALGG